MKPLRVAFVVQGEGRGHMTQALALAGVLREAGHLLDSVHVGTSPYRSVPSYFVEGIGAAVHTFPAPTQVPGSGERGASFSATVVDAARRLPAFVASGRRIHAAVEVADVVVNFLDLVTGLSRIVFRTRTPCVAVAHNHLFRHPALGTPPGGRAARGFVQLYTGATAAKSVTRVALSFAPLPPDPRGRLLVAPPLLRPGIGTLEPYDGDYLLAYALNAGYANEIARWHGTRPGRTTHCYVDGGAAVLDGPAPAGFRVHDLDQNRFLDHLAGCRAFAGSAGFESLCEAHHLGKPALAVPTEGQLEQRWNAWDAERCGVARAGGWGDLDAFWASPPVPSPEAVEAFRRWVSRAGDIVLGAVEAAAGKSGR